MVHEAAAEVGSRFQGDYQGLENWTTENDVLDELRGQGIACTFAAMPCRAGVVFDAWGTRYEIRGDYPLFYVVERGPGPGTLDSTLLAQARELVGLEMKPPRPHGGAGNFRVPASAYSGTHPVVGEQAGFQDTLWGFGMRIAIASGVLAARSLSDGGNYDARWRSELDPLLRTGVVNRAFYGILGNRGYRWLLRRASGGSDVREFLRRHYHPSLVKRLSYPWAYFRVQSRRHDVTCDHVDCACVWCRHGGTA